MSSSFKQFEWIGLYRLLRRVEVLGTVINVEPLHIGAGKVSEAFGPTDQVVVKIRRADGLEVPLIPGSSWKGAIRAYATKLMRSIGLNVCSGLTGDSCLSGNKFRELEKLEKQGARYEDVIRAIVSGEIRICLACLIFGSPGFASHARFFDSYIAEGYRLGYRTMIAIDRRTGAAHRGALFTTEYIEPGAKTNIRIEFINLPNYAIGVIAETLLDMDMGLLKIGGLKTRGFGWIKIEDMKISAYDYTLAKKIEDEIPPLDPYDSPVKLATDWRRTLENFVDVWRSSVDKLKKVSDAGWRWLL